MRNHSRAVMRDHGDESSATECVDLQMVVGSTVLTDLYAPIREDLARVERLIEKELESDHPLVGSLCERLKGYRGKMLRPALVLLTGRSLGEIRREHLTLSGVVEIVHLATLLHDDVLDESRTRRGQRTINATHGNETAVMLGDYLISHAYHLCSSLADQRASRMISATTNVVCEGEILEIHHRHDAGLTVERYFDIIRAKTAALTAVSAELGAIYAGADATVIEALREYGFAAGMAFQIIDDILDLTGDELTTGKTLGLDLSHGSATLPVIHCLQHADEDIRRELGRFVTGRRRAARADVRDWLTRSGSVDYAFGVARQFVDNALSLLRVLPDGPSRDSLLTMTEFILRRRH
jgi:octaprenyl-diphosphate synthase